MGQCLGCFYHIPLIRRLSSNAQRSDTYENTGLVEAEVLNRSLENIFIHPTNKHHSKPNEADISRRNLSKCNQDNEQQKYGSCTKPKRNRFLSIFSSKNRAQQHNYVKQCNEVYPNDMQRNHSSPFEIAHQNQSLSSKDTSCIEMFDLAMYASNKENSFTSSTQSALPKNKGSIENVNYVRLGNTDNRYDNTNVVARAVAQCNYPTITLPRASKRENCDNRQNEYESNPNEALKRSKGIDHVILDPRGLRNQQNMPDFKPGSHWSISSSQKFGARTEEYSDFFQGRTRIWENDLHPSIGSIHEGQNPLKRLKNVYGTSKGVGSNSSIDLEWETAEEAVIPSFVGPITMEIGGLHDLHQIDSITQLSDSKENGQLHRNKENSTEIHSNYKHTMSPLSNNSNCHKSIRSRTSNIKSNSPYKFQKLVQYEDNGTRIEQITPIKKVINCSSESSSVNSIPGLDWDSQIDDVNLSNSIEKDTTIDTETEKLITAIENLTSRALKETGQQWESMETDMLQPIKIESSVNGLINDVEQYTSSAKNPESQISQSCKDKESNISNKGINSSCESSSCSSNMFSVESSDIKEQDSVTNEGLMYDQDNGRTGNKIYSNDQGTPVISTIGYTTKHIKINTQALEDNNFKNKTLSNNYSTLNNNENTKE